jgi:hypothetical protein
VNRGNAHSAADGSDGDELAIRVVAPRPAPGAPPVTDAEIIAALRTLDTVTGPDQLARARMRANILAELRSAQPPATAASWRHNGAGQPRARASIAVAAALTLVLSLSGLGILLARGALPGDTLYGVKRMAESISLTLTFGDESTAHKHLDHAAARVHELEALAAQQPKPGDTPVDAYHAALSDLDNDATAGSRQLITLATRGDVGRLESLRAWAAGQRDRLATMAPLLPSALRSRHSVSAELLSRIVERAESLLRRGNCYQMTTGATDDVGALPATTACSRPSQPGDVDLTRKTVPTEPSSVTLADDPGHDADQSAPAPPSRTATVTVPIPPVLGATPPPGLPVWPVPAITQPTVKPLLPLPLLDLPQLLAGLPGLQVG